MLMLMSQCKPGFRFSLGDTWCGSIDFIIVRLILFKSHLVDLSFVCQTLVHQTHLVGCWHVWKSHLMSLVDRIFVSYEHQPAGLVGPAPTVTVCKSASSWLTSKLVDSKLRALKPLIVGSSSRTLCPTLSEMTTSTSPIVFSSRAAWSLTFDSDLLTPTQSCSNFLPIKTGCKVGPILWLRTKITHAQLPPNVINWNLVFETYNSPLCLFYSQERRQVWIRKHSGLGTKVTPSCKWPISSLKNLTK